MKLNNIIWLLAISALLSLYSCTKESESINQIPDTPEDVFINPLVDNTSTRDDGSVFLGCFSIQYPFSMDIDGTVHEITDAESFATVTNLAENATHADFVYPITVEYEDGNTSTANNAEEFGELFASCIPTVGWSETTTENLIPAFLINDGNFCYELQYPVTVTNLNTEQEVNSESELITMISEQDVLFFTLPISLINNDGDVITLGDPDDFFVYLSECTHNTIIIDGEFGIGQFGCYTIQYPFNALDQDGNTVSIANDEEHISMIVSGNFDSYAFPLTLLNEDGEETIVNSIEEINEAVEDCPTVGIEDNLSAILVMFSLDMDGPGCYHLNYPIQLVIGQDEPSTANNKEELLSLLESSDQFTVVLPASVTMEDGEVRTITNLDEIMALIEECQG